MPLVPIASIKVSDRMRVDLGDETLNGLVDSLREYGQLQPILVDADNNLIAGGRRYTAATKLGWTEIMVHQVDKLPDDVRAEMELEENIRRKDFTWQERCLGILRTHRLKRRKDPKSKWGYRQTGELLGVHYTQINKLVVVGELLERGDAELNACENFAEALGKLAARKAAEAQKLLAINEQRIREANAKKLLPVGDDLDSPVVKDDNPRALINLSKYFHNADCITHMQEMPPLSVDHVITDIPYGIDMSMVQLKQIDLVEAQHDVSNNVALFEPFLKNAYRVLRDGGYCIFFYDLSHDDKLRKLAKKAGFTVCAWPLIWCKTHACKNDAANVNFTKAIEYAMVLRKKNAILARPQPVNFIVASAAEDRKRYDNPFAKPRTVWRFLIDAVVSPGQIVLDPFAGEMSCPLAVIEAEAQPYAIELIDTHYNKGLEHVRQAYKLQHKGRCDFV